LRVLHTAVTVAPSALAICTAHVPTPPAAPLIRILCPAFNRPASRSPCSATTPHGVAAASSNERLLGLGASRFAGTATYSANAPEGASP
jgi:hypothetical protein